MQTGSRRLDATLDATVTLLSPRFAVEPNQVGVPTDCRWLPAVGFCHTRNSAKVREARRAVSIWLHGECLRKKSTGQTYDYKDYNDLTHDVEESKAYYAIIKRTPTSPGSSATTAETVVQVLKSAVTEFRKL